MISNDLSSYQPVGDPITVKLSYSLVRLLSEQLYQSPLKAIEELVVNAYDANAKVCRIFVPTSRQDNFIAIYDDGDGMDYEGLVDLWQIGHSNKRDKETEIEQRVQRKQIGKFGIGKLASYTIANQLTYITKSQSQVLAVTIDFRKFDPSHTDTPYESGMSNLNPAEVEPVDLKVYKIDNWSTVADTIKPVFQKLSLTETELEEQESWTLAILENFKGKGRDIKHGRLKWVLRTAMPRQSDFQLSLNKEEVSSSRSEYETVIEFSVTDLPEQRLKDLSIKTGVDWYTDNGQLKTDNLFDEGISGTVVVTQKTLTGGKSADIGRSHGFFIRVRDRLINEGDPLFGLKPLVYDTFNRLDAQIYADDLDKVLTASRDSFETTHITDCFQEFLLQVFYEADSRYKTKIKKGNGGKKEGEKEIVEPRLVEFPLADGLLTHSYDEQGAEADEGWFYIEMQPDVDLDQLVQLLYTRPRSKYRYQYTAGRQTDRVVKFNPAEATFWLNDAHEFVREYMGEASGRQFLQDFVTAEMLLEVYMRERHIPPHLIGGILEQRDELLRSLAHDRSYSFETIARNLRQSATDEHELEINLVVAMRALGFTARQVSGSGEPDGIARYTDYPGGEKKLILEAKSSQGVPSLSAIDFAGLDSHKINHGAQGCLLVAPAYPGETRDNNEAAKRAENLKVSCWTVEQLAQFVESAEKRHLNATHVIQIVENCFTPDQVKEAIDKLFTEPTWDKRRLYQGILKVLKDLDGLLSDMPRNVDLIAGRIIAEDELDTVLGKNVEEGVRQLAAASQGGMIVRDRNVHVHVSIEELERRVAHLTNPQATSPRRLSSFRQ